MAIATLTVDIQAKLAKFEADMGRMTHIVDKSASRLSGAMRGLGAAISLGAITAGFEKLVDSAAALDDMAEKTGASVEELSKLEHVARISGTSLETVETALIRLAKALHSTDEESKGADKALKAIGLSVDELKGLDTAVAMKKVADALAKYEDSAGKTAIAMDLLGKSGAQALPYLKDLAEIGEVNATLTKEQAAEAEQFQKAMNSLGLEASETARAFTVDLLPGLISFIEQMGEGKRIAGSFTELLRLFVFNLDAMTFEKPIDGIKRLTKSLEDYQAAGARGEFRKQFAMSPTGYILGGREEDLKKQIKFLKFLQRQEALALTEGMTGRLDSKDLGPVVRGSLADYTSKAGKDDKGKKDKADPQIAEMQALGREYLSLFESAEKYTLALDAQIAKGSALTQAERQLLEIERQLPKEWADALRPLLERSDALEKQWALMEEGKRLHKETRTDMEQLAETEAHLTKLLEAGAITWDTYARAIFAAGDKLEQIKQPLDQMTEFTKQAAANMQDAMADGFFDIMQGKFDDLAGGFKQTIDRMVANLMASQLMNYLTGDFGKTGVMGGALEGLFKGLLPSYDVGTDFVPATGPALIHRGERIIPAAQNRAGGGMSVTNHFTISGSVDRRSQGQIAAEVGASVDRAMRRNR